MTKLIGIRCSIIAATKGVSGGVEPGVSAAPSRSSKKGPKEEDLKGSGSPALKPVLGDRTSPARGAPLVSENLE